MVSREQSLLEPRLHCCGFDPLKAFLKSTGKQLWVEPLLSPREVLQGMSIITAQLSLARKLVYCSALATTPFHSSHTAGRQQRPVRAQLLANHTLCSCLFFHSPEPALLYVTQLHNYRATPRGCQAFHGQTEVFAFVHYNKQK